MILFSLIIFISAIIQGMTSFGFSLVAMPFLTLFLPLKLIVPTLVICSLVLNLVIFSKMKGKLHIKRILVMLVIGIISTPIGVELLTIIDERILKASVGTLVIFSALIMMKDIHVSFSNKTLTYAITGFFSGVLNGSVSLSGPPVVLMLVNEGEEKDNFKKNISGYFLALNIFTIPSFLAKGLISTDVLKMFSVGSVVIVVGAFIGIKIGEYIDETKFKKIVLVMIMLMGIMTLASIF